MSRAPRQPAVSGSEGAVGKRATDTPMSRCGQNHKRFKKLITY